MKQILGILFLGLLLSGNSFAGVEEVIKEIKKNKDIAQGFNEVKEFDTWNEWRVTNKALIKSDKTIREYVVKIVNKSDNHPVRFGNQSLRFEVRAGDGWGWDARNDRERVELLICCVNKKTTWTSWSLYLPNDYEKIFPAKTMLAQFHNDADNPPAFAFDNQSEPNANEGGGYWIGVEEYINKKYLKKKTIRSFRNAWQVERYFS
jgi:putative component of toxin-antitoxin plasmid stabilization module